MPQATIIDLTPKERGVEGGAVEDPLRYALCVEELVICDNRRKSAVKFLLFVVAAGKSSLSPFLGMQGVG